jgi:hypothetical protein
MPEVVQTLRGLIQVAALAVLFTGCTMCPNAFDYAGPVPNGSAPQNDFRARSNGIAPIGASPKPWPPIVKSKASPRAAKVAAAATPSKPKLIPKPTPAPASRREHEIVRVAGEEDTGSDESGWRPLRAKHR